MLLKGMRLLKDEGMDTAVLGVDAENPSGALRLYESVGFANVGTTSPTRKISNPAPRPASVWVRASAWQRI